MADTDILLGGFGLFGGRGEYTGKIKVITREFSLIVLIRFERNKKRKFSTNLRKVWSLLRSINRHKRRWKAIF